MLGTRWNQSNQGGYSLQSNEYHGYNSRSRSSIRMDFLRKVYGILSVQLLFTAAIGALFMIYSANPLIVTICNSAWIFWTLFAATMLVLVALLIMAEETPHNYFLLALFTFLESIFIGTLVAGYSAPAVLRAVGLTLTITVCLTLYTFQSSRDYSSWEAGVFCSLAILLEATILHAMFPVSAVSTVVTAVGALLFCFYIIFDTWLLLEKLSPEQYILGVTLLYLDILNLFIRLLGDRQNDD